MPRLITLAAVALIGGLAVPLILAGACALRAPLERPCHSSICRYPDDPEWQDIPRSCGNEPDPVSDFDGRLARLEASLDPGWLRTFESTPNKRFKSVWSEDGPGLTVEWLSCFVPDQPDGAEVESVRAGWPYPCLIGRTVTMKPAPSVTIGRIRAPAWLFPREDPFGPARRLPLTPLWPGLLADTGVFTGAILALMWVAALVRAFRNRLRHDPDRCPSCNYHLLGLPPNAPCPECGVPAPARP